MSSNGSSSVSLSDVLPWGDSIPSGGRTILICDSTETDGRFLLHTLACQSSSGASGSGSNSMSMSNSMGNNASGINSKSMHRKRKENVLWIHCGCSTEMDIRAALKKAGCDSSLLSTSASLSSSTFSTAESLNTKSRDNSVGDSSDCYAPFEIINVLHELSEYHLSKNSKNTDMNTVTSNNATSSNNNQESTSDCKNMNAFVKSIYLKVKHWIHHTIITAQSNQSIINPLVIIDNATLLSTQIGPQLTHTLCQKIQSLLSSTSTTLSTTPSAATNTGIGCLAILCSHDFDQEYYLNSTQQSKRNTNVTGGKIMQYIGAAGRGTLVDSMEMASLKQKADYELLLLHDRDDNGSNGINNHHYWERSLVELADGIIDVLPLPSGFARDVHGRLIFTERLGSALGWKHFKHMRNTGTSDTSAGNNTTSSSTHGNNFSTTTVNYCCYDSGVRAIRLRV